MTLYHTIRVTRNKLRERASERERDTYNGPFSQDCWSDAYSVLPVATGEDVNNPTPIKCCFQTSINITLLMKPNLNPSLRRLWMQLTSQSTMFSDLQMLKSIISLSLYQHITGLYVTNVAKF